MMRRTAQLVGMIGIAAGLVLAPTMPALAHNYVVSSTPAEGETVTTVPQFFVVTTNENMLDLSGEGAGFAIQITDDNGLFYGDGCVTTEGPSMSMIGVLGAAGDYTMTYQYVSADGHTLSDSLAFSYAPTGDSVAQAGAGAGAWAGADIAPVCGGVSPTEVNESTAAENESSTVLNAVVAIVAGLAVVGAIVAILRRRRRHPR